MSNRELGGRRFGLLVYRYAYYVRGVSLITDSEYDRLERAYTRGGGVLGVGSDIAKNYHPIIRKQAEAEIRARG